MGRKNINVVLDLDNTCIYSHECSRMKQIPDWLPINYTYRVMDDDYIVCERPGLQDFLDWLFDNFNVNEDYPFMQYMTSDSQLRYKYYTKMKKLDDPTIITKWFENSSYGISFKIKVKEIEDKLKN